VKNCAKNCLILFLQARAEPLASTVAPGACCDVGALCVVVVCENGREYQRDCSVSDDVSRAAVVEQQVADALRWLLASA
jgi:hypothetical protein